MALAPPVQRHAPGCGLIGQIRNRVPTLQPIHAPGTDHGVTLRTAEPTNRAFVTALPRPLRNLRLRFRLVGCEKRWRFTMTTQERGPASGRMAPVEPTRREPDSQ